MSQAPAIRIVKVEYGPWPAAASLNPRIAPDSLLLRATLVIRWEEPHPLAAIARLEQALLDLSPGFARHECRGPRAYHVFLGDGAPAPALAPAPAPGPPSHGAGGPPEARGGFDGGLALAHLIEHVVLDFLCAITHERRCSGFTGVLRDPPGRFDLMVECGDFGAGRFCLALAVASVTSALQGRALGAMERETLLLARLVYTRPGQALTPPAAARALGWTERQAARALAVLRDLGYLSERTYTVNLSGIPEYRVADA